MHAHQLGEVVLAVTTVFHIVQVVARFFTQEPHGLGASHMEVLFAARLVALHTCANYRSTLLTTLFTDVARLNQIGELVL